MKVIEKVQYTAERRKVVRRTCDSCGARLPLIARNSLYIDVGDIKIKIAIEGKYEIAETSVEDLCDTCKAKLVKVLTRDFGAKTEHRPI